MTFRFHSVSQIFKRERQALGENGQSMLPHGTRDSSYSLELIIDFGCRDIPCVHWNVLPIPETCIMSACHCACVEPSCVGVHLPGAVLVIGDEAVLSQYSADHLWHSGGAGLGGAGEKVI